MSSYAPYKPLAGEASRTVLGELARGLSLVDTLRRLEASALVVCLSYALAEGSLRLIAGVSGGIVLGFAALELLGRGGPRALNAGYYLWNLALAALVLLVLVVG